MPSSQLNRFEFGSAKYYDDPWQVFADFRSQGALIRMKFPLIGKGWAATTYDAVTQVLRDDSRFVRDSKNAGRSSFGWIQYVLPRSIRVLTNNMVAKDGDEHRRLRSLVDQAFTRRNIDGMSSRLEQLAEEQFTNVKTIGSREGSVDLVDEFARPFPLTVICELLGVPLDDRPLFRKWFAPFSNFRGILDLFRMASGASKMIKYLRNQFPEVRKRPREGLMSELVAVQTDAESLSEDELLAMVFMLFVAGHETTVHLISNCLLTLAQLPEVRTQLVSDWSRCDAFIEEVLRYNSPIQIAKPRFVSKDTEFFGQALKRGETVTPLLASANYDPARFEDPDSFKIDREQNYHLSFGSGPHTCLGIKLARAETYWALKTLLTAWPDFEIDFPLDQVDWAKRPGMRGIQTFRVKQR
ncbi:MAG: cytochrome P450 [Planctomycetota bacterium]